MTLSSLEKRWDIFISTIEKPVFYNRILLGLKNTLIIAGVGFLIGLIIGSLLAIAKLLPKKFLINRILSKICDLYITLFRGTPMVVQLLVGFYLLLPLFSLKMPALNFCLVTFGLNSGAYIAEIMRGGILAVDKGQMEAGRSLGLNYIKTMWYVVIPQAVKNIIPMLGNELITLVKETSIVSFVGAVDLFTAFQMIGAKNYEYMMPYLFMAIIYIVMIIILTVILKIIEGRLRASDKR